MGAWIEINVSHEPRWLLITSHPTMGAWIEISNKSLLEYSEQMSHPTMGAWIEIIAIQIHIASH